MNDYTPGERVVIVREYPDDVRNGRRAFDGMEGTYLGPSDIVGTPFRHLVRLDDGRIINGVHSIRPVKETPVTFDLNAEYERKYMDSTFMVLATEPDQRGYIPIRRVSDGEFLISQANRLTKIQPKFKAKAKYRSVTGNVIEVVAVNDQGAIGFYAVDEHGTGDLVGMPWAVRHTVIGNYTEVR